MGSEEPGECAVKKAQAILGGKYKTTIIWYLRDGPLRHSELQRRIPEAAPKMLTQHLRDLERDGVVLRTVHPVVPPHVEYSLTASGRGALPVMKSMCRWWEKFYGSPS